MRNFLYTHRMLVALVAFVITWSAFILIIGPTQIRESLGVGSGYILLLIVSLIGGASSITSVSYYSTLATLAAAGYNPVILGLIAGAGEIVGDSAFYLIGYHGREAAQMHLPARIEKYTTAFREWLLRQKTAMVSTVVFLYSGFTPFPNDVVTVSLGFARYNFFAVIIPLLLGNMVRAMLIASGVGYTASTFFGA